MNAKEILLNELKEQTHPEKVEDVIFWALEYYANSEPKETLGRIIAYSIKERIKEAEKVIESKLPVPFRYPLFNHMAEAYNLNLINDELDLIINIVNKISNGQPKNN